MQQDDTWIYVSSKSKRSRHPAAAVQPTQINPPSKDLTLEKLTAEFTSKLKTWQTSSCRKTVLQIFKRIEPEAGCQFHKAICLGSGSLSRENLECRRRSLWQMVVFYDLARYLLGDEGDVFAQEPAFTALDKEFLAGIGIQILDVDVAGVGNATTTGLGPAKHHLGPKTFIFEPFIDMNAAMLQEILEKEVGLYMGSSIRGILEREGSSGVGKLAKEFAEGRMMLKFPTFEVDPNVMDGIGIYWKEEVDE